MEDTKEMDVPQVANIPKKQQVIAVLSSLSNCNQNSYEISETALQEKATSRITTALKDSTLTDFIGKWELVWGPCLKNSVVSDKKNNPKHVGQYVTDNTMYVVKSQDPEDPTKTLYVVAVAGTNAISDFGWVDEDAKVGVMVDWNGVPKAKISKGSSDGLGILLKMKDNKNDLLQFFSTLNLNENVEIATCGHSLGGALSPLLALKLIEMKEINTINNLTVSCYPSAGPTSGNAALARFAEKKLANNYHSVINNYDIVPHAWEVAMLDKIPTIYNSDAYGRLALTGKSLDLLRFKESQVKLILANYTRIYGRTTHEYTFDGKPKGASEAPMSLNISALSEGNDHFFCQASYQHTTVYNQSNALDFPKEVTLEIQKYIQP
ncbi:lipase (class 3) [Flavobacterium sp. 1]|uniref:lipase family protein n=1 Tax=Flavobacterium sp. 1 TaxID=2035200 RepID=UPI000C24E9AF|nr:lipase [Flavobacterium sp. 1]PJJ09002.1 lipase (class 3) [Flavobacterium sp. 1]